MSSVEKLGLYVQVPFCTSKCSFCNFSSGVAPSSVFARYCEHLRREIQTLPEHYRNQGIAAGVFALPVDTIYIGGGTPSLVGAELLGSVVESLRQRFRAEQVEEFTIEITPGSADDEFLRAARRLGMNRLSIGAQSFEDTELRLVGRLHSAADTDDQVARACRAGFRNITLDLIAGLPEQTEDSWQRTLSAGLSLAPQHVSIYLFEIDGKSRLGREVLESGSRYHAGEVPSENFMAAAYESARGRLERAGYEQYEISNFALPGFRSRHNLKYWELAPYLGLGAGAHSFDGSRRWSNAVAAEDYESRLESCRSPIAEIRRLPQSEQIEEFFFLGLRRRQGVDLASARQRWGAAELQFWEERIAALAHDGWLERAGDRVCLAGRALLVSNEIFQEFIAA